MWTTGWREKIWNELDRPWDLVVIGGGITGAAILREGTRHGLRVLLVEANDFAWGASSRSSKMVHGGLRYLKEGQFGLTRAAVRERVHLLRDAPGLVEPLGFVLASYRGDWPSRRLNAFGVMLYDLMARQWQHRLYNAEEMRLLAPRLNRQRMVGGTAYSDALTDDARLVLRVIREAVADGGRAINYVRATELLRQDGRVTGVRLLDVLSGAETEVNGRVIINATGAWADRLRAQVGATPRLRPLRGSHLVFPAWRLPVAQSISFLHPEDGRWVYVYPWEGVTVVGTTDVDHCHDLDEEPRISPDEVAYLMAAVTARYPSLNITLADVLCTFAGVRPVVDSGADSPSHESREHVVWQEAGLLTVTGGKLTTFRLIALDALQAVQEHVPHMTPLQEDRPVLDAVDLHVPLPDEGQLSPAEHQRLTGRYGREAALLVVAARPGELIPIGTTSYLWAELRWAARAEGVMHLDDLLLRRLRIGLLLPEGGRQLMPQSGAICREELGWDETRWQEEVAAYEALWHGRYSLPPANLIPNWEEKLQKIQQTRQRRQRHRQRFAAAGGLLAVSLALAGWYTRHRS